MKKENLTSIGAIVTALLAAVCCLGPLIFVIFGTSIAFLGRLSFMEIFRPYLLAAAGLMFAYAFWVLYLRKFECTCTEDVRTRKKSRIIFWIGFVVFVLALSFKSIMLWIYE